MSNWKLIVWSKNDFFVKEMLPALENIQTAYREKGILSTCIRELMLKFDCFGKQLWYNPKLKDLTGTLIVMDAMISEDYLRHLSKNNPDARLIFWYWNRVQSSKVKPQSLKELGYEVWSFNTVDCIKYDLKLNHTFYTKEIYENFLAKQKDQAEIEYDLAFVGRDKGRMEIIENIKNVSGLEDLNWFTYFIADHFYETHKNKMYHRKNLTFTQVLNIECCSRAILEIVPDNSSGLTVRCVDALCLEKKLVTNNKEIMKMDFYRPNNIFVLGIDKLENLKSFLELPYEKVNEDIKVRYEFSRWIERFLA